MNVLILYILYYKVDTQFYGTGDIYEIGWI